MESEALWWRVLEEAKYGECRNGWNSLKPGGPVGCSLWHNICKGLNLFQRFTWFSVNNREKMLFWMDRWH